MKHKFRTLVAAGAAVLLGIGTLGTPSAMAAGPDPHNSLAFEAPKDLLIGTALASGPATSDPTYAAFAAKQFNSVTPENEMKWDTIHPAADRYNFAPADAIVAFAQAHGQQVRGHTLLWHSQNPSWVTTASWTCEQARGVLKDHITTVVSHFRGKIYQWDVANEIFHDPWDAQGVALRTDQNPFLKACAADPVALLEDAFRWAHAADPNAVLFLNDYNVEGTNEKADAYYALAKRMLADGVPLGGFGLQAHLSLQYGFDNSLQANMERFDALGLQTAITEADVRIPTGGVPAPTAVQLSDQAGRYASLLQACINVLGCKSFTVWGFNDNYSWVPKSFPGQDWATISNRDWTLKPAYSVMLTMLRDATPGKSPRKNH